MLIKTYESGCPICSGDVAGNYKNGYFCKGCNIMFKSFQLNKGSKLKEVVSDNPEAKEKLEKSISSD